MCIPVKKKKKKPFLNYYFLKFFDKIFKNFFTT